VTVAVADRATSRLIDRLIAVDDQLAVAGKVRGELVAKLLARVEPGASIDNGIAVVTAVQGRSTSADFDAMVAADPKWMAKVTRTVFDSAKFGLLRKAGEVPDRLLEHVIDTPTTPYLKVTRR